MLGAWRNNEKASLKSKDEDDTSVRVTKEPFHRNEILICATYGHLYALRKSNGSILWDTKLGVMGNVASVFITDTDKVIAAGLGKTICMDLFNGQRLWVNKMPGFGYESVSILATPSKFLPPNTDYGQHNAPPNYEKLPETNADTPIVISTTRGKVMAMNSFTGQTKWTYNCPGGRFRIPATVIEPPSAELGRERGVVYIGSGKYVYCLDSSDGNEIWTLKVCDFFFGYGFMTFATHWSSRLAAEAFTCFSQNPVAQVREVEREQEESA